MSGPPGTWVMTVDFSIHECLYNINTLSLLLDLSTLQCLSTSAHHNRFYGFGAQKMQSLPTSHLLPLLCYRRLCEDNVIPDLIPERQKAQFPILLNRLLPKKYSYTAFSWFYENYFSQYQQRDYTSSNVLDFYNKPDAEPWSLSTLPSIWNTVCNRFSAMPTDVPTSVGASDSLRKWQSSHAKIYESIRKHDSFLVLNQTIETPFTGVSPFQKSNFLQKTGEYNNIRISATPYALGADTVYTLMVLKDTRSEEGERLLLHAVLDFFTCKSHDSTFKALAVILPLQKTVVFQDFSDWDFAELSGIIAHSIPLLNNAFVNSLQYSTNKGGLDIREAEQLIHATDKLVGTTITKEKPHISIPKYCNKSPKLFQIQMTTVEGGDTAGYTINTTVSKKNYVTIYKALLKKKTAMFVLVPPQVTLLSDPKWAVPIIRNDIKVAEETGAAGIVLQMGIASSRSGGLAKTLEMATKIAEMTPENLIIYLEPSCDNEIGSISSVSALTTFYKQVNRLNKFRLCISTSRAFAGGYLPELYVASLLAKCPNSIGLIHFNGCKKELGSMHDARTWDWTHQAIYTYEMARDIAYGGDGKLELADTSNKIPLRCLLQVAGWCEENSIPFIMER